MILNEGRIPLTDEETEAINSLLPSDAGATLSRRDPGETGPVVVQLEGHTYEIHGSQVVEV